MSGEFDDILEDLDDIGQQIEGEKPRRNLYERVLDHYDKILKEDIRIRNENKI